MFLDVDVDTPAVSQAVAVAAQGDHRDTNPRFAAGGHHQSLLHPFQIIVPVVHTRERGDVVTIPKEHQRRPALHPKAPRDRSLTVIQW